MANLLENKSLDEVCEWLEEKRFPGALVECFKEQEMDGNAIAVGLASSPGPDWLKDVIPKVGQRLKVHDALRALYLQCQPSSPESRDRHDHSPFSPPGDLHSPTDGSVISAGSLKTVSVASGSGQSSQFTTPKRVRKVGSLPDPFPIPKFRPITTDNFNKKLLTDKDRKYVVQTLATMLMTYVSRPSLTHCGHVATALVDKFEFLKDGEGEEDGEHQHSWKWFIYYRCQNVNRPATPDGSAPKRLKLDSRAVHFYPPTSAEDDVSFGRNIELLKAELLKPKPRPEVQKDLMRRTFPNRWSEFVSQPVPLLEYLSDYSLLKKATYATLDLSLICKREDIRDDFEEVFPQWARAIIRYCKETQIRCTALQLETEKYSDDLTEDHCTLMALRCLTILFAPMKSKKLGENIPYILKIVPRGTPPADATDKNNNQPHVVWFRDEDDDCLMQQYFVSVEQQLMMESCNLLSALFLCIAAHYVFNLSYSRKAGDMWLFIQEKILSLPSKAGIKRHPSSTAHFSGISRIYESMNVVPDNLSEED